MFEVDRSEHSIISLEGNVKKTVERERSPTGHVIGIDSFPNWTAKDHGNRDIWKRICYFKLEQNSHNR
ncbi:MAG: hypothetical protein ABJB76_13065 [Candidatus Nitrosocosmicus sp.]